MKQFQEFVGDNQEVFVKCLINSQDAPNVIFLMTPITTVDHELAIKYYKPLFKV